MMNVLPRHLVKRSPWIAMGAAGMLLMDRHEGRRRRSALMAAVRPRVRGAFACLARRVPEHVEASQLVMLIDRARVSQRAVRLLPEEQAAGIDFEAALLLAQAVLEESEMRTVEPVPAECRRSEHAVVPVAI